MTKLKEVSGVSSQLCKNTGGHFRKFNEQFHKPQFKPEGSRQNYTDLFDSAPVGCLLFNRRGLVERVNIAGARMLGAEKDAMAGRPVLTLFAKASYPKFFDHLAGAVAMKDKQTCEIELRRADGTTFWAKFTTAPVTDSAGAFVHFRTIVVDITDRRC